MSYILYEKNQSTVSEKVIVLFQEQGVHFSVVKTQSLKLNNDQVQDLLDMLGLWAIDLVEKSHPLWIDGCLNEESDDREIVDFITHNPSVLRDAIVVKDGRQAIIADPPENVFSLF